MTKQGWPSRMAVRLPDGWELREDEDFHFLYGPDGEAYVYGRYVRPETVEADARMGALCGTLCVKAEGGSEA